MDILVRGAQTTHDVLSDRLETAAATSTERNDPRSRHTVTDTFLAGCSRHVNAVLDVLVPAARHRLPDGRARAHEYVAAARRLEQSLCWVKARLYGSTYAVRQTWGSVWADVRRDFETCFALEQRLAEDLAAHRREGDPDWAERLYRAELKAPTRPHPYVPHRGLGGHVARRAARRVDRFWDAAEGRMLPEPVRHHDREHQGRMKQYLLADPHLPDD